MFQNETVSMPERDALAAISPVWKAVLSLAGTNRDCPDSLPAQAAEVFSPALLAACLSAEKVPVTDAPGHVRQSRLLNRFVRSNGLRWLRLALEAGVQVLAIKGLATAHALYPDPDLRAMSDADLLVRRSELDRLLDVLGAAGLRFRPATAASPWGFVSDASFQALTSADEASNVDLHVHPDGWPLHRALSTEDVFAGATDCGLTDGPLPVPCPLHMLIMTISHAARDRFQIETAKSFVDTALLLQAHGDTLDWSRFEAICKRAWMLAPAGAYLALLQALGGDVSAVPERLRRAPRTAEFERALFTFARLDTAPSGTWARLRREALLASTPPVFLLRTALRLKGLVRPNSGLPPTAERKTMVS